MVKKYICPQCDNEFASRQSLWKHKQKQRCHGQSARIPTQVPSTFIAAAVKESSPHKHRPKNPKIQALLDEIVNDCDSKRHVSPPQVIHKGFSIVPPTTASPSSKPLRMKKMKKIKLSSPAARSKEDIRNLPQSKRIEYSDTDDDAESPLDDNDDDDREINHPRTKGDIIGNSNEDGDDEDSEIMDQEQHIEKEVAKTDDDEDLEDRFNHLLIEYTREKKSESGQELVILFR